MSLPQLLPTISPSEISQSKPEFDYDIAIVGGGIVGTTLACSLKDSSLKVAIIETQTPSLAAAKKQAYALSLMSGDDFRKHRSLATNLTQNYYL